jgi:hypothetical protein
MGQVGAVADRLGEFRVKLLRHHQKPGPAVLEHEAVIILGQQRVDWNRDHTGLDRAEEGGRPIDAVEKADENALLAADVERLQRAGEAVDPRGEIAIGPAPARIDIGDFLAAPGVQIVFEHRGREIVVARDRVNGRGRRQSRLSDIHCGVPLWGVPGSAAARHASLTQRIMPTRKFAGNGAGTAREVR